MVLRRDLANFILAVLIFGIVFFRALTELFAINNDYSLWSYTNQICCSGFPESQDLVRYGRWLGSLLLNYQFSFFGSFEDLRWGRLVSVLLTGLSITLMARMLRQRAVHPLLAFCGSCGIFLLPASQLYIVWLAQFPPGIVAILLTICSWLLFARARVGVGLCKCLYYGLSGILLLAALFIYPPSAMFFIAMAATDYLFSVEDANSSFLFAKAAGFLLLLAAFYFASHKIFLHFSAPSEFRSGYEFALSWNIQDKIQLFFLALSPTALSLWINPSSIPFAILVLAGLVLTIIAGRRNPFTTLVILGSAFAISSLPSLVASGNFMSHRLLFTYPALVVLLGVWAIGFWAKRFERRPGAKFVFYLVVMGVFLVGPAIAARLNTDATILNAQTEYSYVQDRISEGLIRRPKEIAFIRPKLNQAYIDFPLTYDFAVSATNFGIVSGLVEQILLDKTGNPKAAKVATKYRPQALLAGDVPSDVLVIDMNPLVPTHLRNTAPPYNVDLLTGEPGAFSDSQ